MPTSFKNVPASVAKCMQRHEEIVSIAVFNKIYNEWIAAALK